MSKKPVATSGKRQSHMTVNDSNRGGDIGNCSSLFVEPVKWMEILILGVLSGKLCCPKCRNKLGSFNWSGAQCSCGAWVAPAFQLHKNAVDHATSA
ncbi:dual specificity protein phosphatase 12-like [Convolutriloba macropyga]|uniref:dual specificity protein phosphatase 12-like n=1 Tax=Convolutriloba macropyga TaxID=536237 RepID=UPI003F51B26E